MDFAYFFIQHLIYLTLNCGILVVFLNTAKTPSYNFTLNVVVGSITAILLLFVLGLDYYAMLDVTGPWLCGIQAFMKKLVVGVLPLTLVGISYERVRSLPNVKHDGCAFPVWKVVCLTWGVAAVLSLPQFFAYEFYNPDFNTTSIGYTHREDSIDSVFNSSWMDANVPSFPHSSQCRKTPLLGMIWVKVCYESLLCILLHLSPSVYIIYALHKIKFKWKYICLNKAMKSAIGPSLYKKLKQNRLAFVYSVLFALIWVPYGLITVWRAITEDPHRVVVNANFKSPKRNAQNCLEGAFVTLHPFVYLYTHHNTRVTRYLTNCKCKLRNNPHQVENDSDEIMEVSNIPLETF